MNKPIYPIQQENAPTGLKMPLKLKSKVCLRCLGAGYYEDYKGTARFCPDCLESIGIEQMGTNTKLNTKGGQ